MKLDDELDRVIGDGPPHRPLAETIAAGQRTVRRRRALGGGAAALALVAVVGGWGLTSGDGDAQSRDPGFADTPSESADQTPTLLPGEDVGLGEDCEVLHAPGVRVEETIADPFGDADDAACVVAVAYVAPDGRWWSTLTQQDAGGIVSTTGRGVDDQPAAPTFEAQVRKDSLTAYPDLVSFGGSGETLQAADGVTILDQTGDVGELENFADPGDRTAAALVERGPFRWFVLVREIEGGPDVIPEAATDPNETLPQFLDRARQKYASGEGLL